VAHEMGHELGLPDLGNAADAHDLIFIDLVDGERRLPTTADVILAGGDTFSFTFIDPPLPRAAPAAPSYTSGNDTIDAGYGGAMLTGGTGADNFVFADVAVVGPTPPPLTHVTDYHFAEGDRFDFSALVPQNHGTGMGDDWLVRAVENPGGESAILQVNTTPFQKLSTWVDVAQLDGAHTGDAVSVLIDHSAVHLAQIHVGLL
jgi:large repetitive protein